MLNAIKHLKIVKSCIIETSFQKYVYVRGESNNTSIA